MIRPAPPLPRHESATALPRHEVAMALPQPGLSPRTETQPVQSRPQEDGWKAREGSAVPQGVSWLEEERAYNFALYSKHAERVTLLLYGDDSGTPLLRFPLDPLTHWSGRIWHCCLPAAALDDARYYAYSVDGPAPVSRVEWHAFDAEKVLLDPYARAVHFPAAFDRDAARRAGSNAGRAPLGVVRAAADRFPRDDETRPRHEADTLIYELHVRGFTMRAPDVAPERRGTFLGIVDRIPYLKDLGVTAVELMPVFQLDPQAGDYWGYMPIGFFAPNAGYCATATPERRLAEFHTLVGALHRAGMEVILDVVYNHTGEADHRGPTYSLKGIDNSTYYLMTDDPAHPYANLTGVGNTLHTANRYVRKLITDSLRFWAAEMHVDGFRFDLASVFARQPDGSLAPEDFGVFGDVISDPELADLRLIAEPWDPTGASLLGRALPGITWAQWNGRFRDDLRRFLRGDPGLVGPLMQRLYGSDDLFPDDPAAPFHPYQSVNYFASHDGFTLYDLVSYERKRNEANGEGNRDGPEQEHAWNCDWEGDEGVPTEVARLRRRQARNFCALLLIANGTPMLRAGDEFLQTQGGNSNPYNQDNETSWLDWGRLERERDFHRFVRRMVAFRRAHPSLARSRFWRGDVRWYGATGIVDLSPDSRCLAFFLSGASERDDDLYVMVNAGATSVPFTIAEGAATQWWRAVDTGLEVPDDVAEAGQEPPLGSSIYPLAAHSVAVLVRGRSGDARDSADERGAR